MSKKMRVEGTDHLYRTPEGAIVNTNRDAYDAYIRKREYSRSKNQTLESLTLQLEIAKSEIEELKSLIKQIIHK
ncbi:MAG: hypothetical protein CMQ57_04905 [Gammaproteobacteria bacterium]|nr:hypothetical protein [Gammaproteobacteria bacterium]|tara:strand:+ start:24217 stop:24438 length:222 start_codon:yes stop_codon:yes gene_type:complete